MVKLLIGEVGKFRLEEIQNKIAVIIEVTQKSKNYKAAAKEIVKMFMFAK